MNNKRRMAIADIAETLRAALSELESLRDEETEAFENMPEGLQMSERGQQSEAAASALDDAVDSVSSAVDSLETAGE